MFLYSLKSNQAHQVTDGMSNVGAVEFDKGGKYLYFTASTDSGPVSFGSMSAFNRSRGASAYVMVLSKDDPSPLLPESDDEKAADKAADKASEKPDEGEKAKDGEKAKKEPPKVKVDLENIDQRTLALPLPSQNYVGLQAGKPGILFLWEARPSMPHARARLPA